MPGEFTIAQWQQFDGDDYWKWAVWLEGEDSALDRVEQVEWRLHPTFPNPIRKKSDRSTKFRLDTAGWGTFQIVAQVHLKDGGKIKLLHELELHYPDESAAPA